MNNKDVQLKIKVYTGVVTYTDNSQCPSETFVDTFVDSDYIGMCKQLWNYINQEYINKKYIYEIIDDLDVLYDKDNKIDSNKVTSLFKTYFEQKNIPNIETIKEIIYYFVYVEGVDIHTNSSEINVKLLY